MTFPKKIPLVSLSFFLPFVGLFNNKWELDVIITSFTNKIPRNIEYIELKP